MMQLPQSSYPSLSIALQPQVALTIPACSTTPPVVLPADNTPGRAPPADKPCCAPHAPISTPSRCNATEATTACHILQYL